MMLQNYKKAVISYYCFSKKVKSQGEASLTMIFPALFLFTVL